LTQNLNYTVESQFNVFLGTMQLQEDGETTLVPIIQGRDAITCYTFLSLSFCHILFAFNATRSPI